ncbi:hypothetical protein NLG97_g4462 [Lecanicillium saksenae]|uniref:Uncharacterized protein n=1 Tax=Lecanicillium saksenae TaxID=468837 RepID=A0ACC1QVE5_9HYPO|nr:hypothetical protein NLG97_g4462 [Lecanicillium saksenae]
MQQVFSVRVLDGTTLRFANPMVGVESPIWKPRVKFREYWRLIREQPDDPAETYHCTYLPNWINASARAFRGIIPNPEALFMNSRLDWAASQSCQLLKSQLRQGNHLKIVKKVLCFGLGDICRKPPEWMKRNAKTDAEISEQEVSFVRGAMTQHAIALTIREICGDIADSHVELLAQDPDYTDETKSILTASGFSIMGEHGAGGFAEIDDTSLVVSIFIEAPLKQIIADIARPPIIISTGFDVFNDSEKPWVDAESPRTVEMWKEYEEKIPFPIAPDEDGMMKKLRDIYIYSKKNA